MDGCRFAVGGAEGKSNFEDLEVDGIMIAKFTLNVLV